MKIIKYQTSGNTLYGNADKIIICRRGGQGITAIVFFTGNVKGKVDMLTPLGS